MKITIWLSVLLSPVVTFVVKDANGQTSLFTLLTAKETNNNFMNKVIETDSLHIMNYEYLYNGSGVGVADFNGDGLSDIFFYQMHQIINYTLTKEI
ncbi:hypothetical protein IM793_08560 [Pedobacter sp. MR2016-19]|uniref:FG-GAP repeat protein n=1 Tax=Pedobacter sp. MR2016-19 TaxID=2780089 RepID=UPI001876E7D0|nr:FG-GAP repeat protein [Pedobacter sp. MR2016-19]MBE5319206.1 hypothetical protein [Pedobacter sp. MR2016-19]